MCVYVYRCVCVPAGLQQLILILVHSPPFSLRTPQDLHADLPRHGKKRELAVLVGHRDIA